MPAAASVGDTTISVGAFKAAYLLVGADRFPPALAKQVNLKRLVLDGLVERSLLADRARELGFQVSDDDVMRRVAGEGTIYVSTSVDAPAFFGSGPRRWDFSDNEGHFSKDNLKRFIQYRLRQSIREFATSQIEETLAHKMRGAIAATVTVSDQELWNTFVQEQEKVSLQYLRFAPAYYGKKLKVEDAALQAWIAAHAKELDEEYEKEKHRYTDLEKQVRARHILVKVAKDASEEDKAAARARATALLERAKAGEDFAELAQKHSDDAASATRGGDLGFNTKGRMVKPFDEAQFTMKAGELSDLVETQFGFHVIRVEAIREGDVPLEEARRELADKRYRKDKAAEQAEQAARAALAELKAGTSMEQVELALKRQRTGASEPASAEQAAGSKGRAGSDGGSGALAKASSEANAEEDDPLAPKIQDAGPFGRTDTAIPGPFDSGPLAKAAFAMSMDQPLAPEPIQLGDDWFVFRLIERTEAKAEEFDDERREQLLDGLLARKQSQTLTGYVKQLVQQADASGELAVNTNILNDEQGAL